MVESIPENLTFEAGLPQHMSTYDGWMSIIQAANAKIDIASFYWTLRGSDIYKDPSDWQVSFFLSFCKFVKLGFYSKSAILLWNPGLGIIINNVSQLSV